MENPRSWGVVIKTIEDVIVEHEKNMRSKDPTIGHSLPAQIYHRLRTKGFVVSDVRDGLIKTMDGKIQVIEEGEVTGTQG